MAVDYRSGLALNMANEGIPMRVIARVLGSTFDQVKEMVQLLFDSGRILNMPPADWPDGERKPSALNSIDAYVEVEVVLIRYFKFPPLQARLCALLMVQPIVTGEDLHRVYGNSDDENVGCIEGKTLGVYICHLRKSLGVLGVHIETVRGRGFALPYPDKHRLFEILFGQLEDGDVDADETQAAEEDTVATIPTDARRNHKVRASGV